MGATQRQQSLFSRAEEVRCYHDSSRWGYFSILAGNEKKKQVSYPLHAMPWVLENLDPTINSWMSHAEFNKRNRQCVNLLRLPLLFSDIDTYKMNWSVGKSPDQLAQAVLFFCDDAGVPPPSILVYSGRGIQAKWLLDEAQPRATLPRWNALQIALTNALHAAGADPQARDASRVLRLVNTVNEKNGEMCRVVHVTTGVDGLPVRYGFEWLAETLLPVSRLAISDRKFDREQAKIQRGVRHQMHLVRGNTNLSGLRQVNYRALAWHRLEDLRTLSALRDGVSEGWRMLMMHWQLNFLLLSGATNSRHMYFEAAALAREIDPTWQHGKGELSTLFDKAQQMERGEWVEFGGRKYPPLYTPRNDTLINLFQITDEEQKQLRTIISRNEASARDRARSEAKRRACGAVTREQYLQASKDNKERAIAMHLRGVSQTAIAEEMGVSRMTVNRWLKI